MRAPQQKRVLLHRRRYVGGSKVATLDDWAHTLRRQLCHPQSDEYRYDRELYTKYYIKKCSCKVNPPLTWDLPTARSRHANYVVFLSPGAMMCTNGFSSAARQRYFHSSFD